MNTAKLNSTALNLVTGLVTLLALFLGGVRVRDYLQPPQPVVAADTTRVANWEEYIDGTRMGPVDAAVTIVEFGDFQCPFCERAWWYLADLMDRRPNDIALIYRHKPRHEFALQAALASECASRQGAIRSFHDIVFRQVDSIGRKAWTALAAEAGVRDTVQLRLCMEDEEVTGRIARDTLAARRLGVHGTPTFLINGLLVPGFLGADRMEQLVNLALRNPK